MANYPKFSPTNDPSFINDEMLVQLADEMISSSDLSRPTALHTVGDSILLVIILCGWTSYLLSCRQQIQMWSIFLILISMIKLRVYYRWTHNQILVFQQI